jgi:3'-5' exoribonuclease
MKSPYIGELQPNQVITGVFLVQSKDVRQKKTGEPYLSLVLGDRSGDIDAKMWDNVAEVLDAFDRDDFVRVKGLMQVYQNRPQFTIHKVVRVLESEVDFADYFPCSERSPEEMFAELRTIVAGVANPHLRALLDAFMDDESIALPYRTAPAAKTVHHAYLGGLIEHVLSLCKLAKLTAAHYRNIDLDLLLAGVILHDVGKIHELTYDRSFGYSNEGQLLGHIVIALRMLDEKVAKVPGFPEDTRTLLAHMIVSHHGELEFGSPRVPLFPEALLLHHLDNLDSKMECMRAAIARDRHARGCWTGYVPSLERTVLKKAKFLESPAESTEPETAPAAVNHSSESRDPRSSRPVSGSLFGDKLQEALRKP